MDEDIRLGLEMKRIEIAALEDQINCYAALARRREHPDRVMVKLLELELKLDDLVDDYHQVIREYTE